MNVFPKMCRVWCAEEALADAVKKMPAEGMYSLYLMPVGKSQLDCIENRDFNMQTRLRSLRTQTEG